MKVYSQHQTPAGTNLTILALESTAAYRPAVNHVILGSDATPANLAGEFILAATTTDGITPATSPAEVISDQVGTATVNAAGGTFVTEPVYGAIFLMIPLNQQATWQWWANPGFEPTALAGAAAGISLRSVGHGGTPNMNCTMAWSE